MYRFFLLICFLNFLPLFSYNILANDGSFHGAGATVFAVKDKRVLMEKEEIIIRYNRAILPKTSEHRLKKWVADCTFTFLNTTNEAIVIQMGFPDHRSHGDGPQPEWTITDFTTTVNDKPVEVTFKKAETSKEFVELKKALKLFYQGVHTWLVHFQPHERIIVKNSYLFGESTSNGPFINVIKEKDPFVKIFKSDLFWNGIKPEKDDWDFSNAAYELTTYIVTTGLTWAGPIGEADIAFEIPPYTLPHLLIPSPGNYTIQDNFVRWKFKRWLPKQEIALYILRPYPPDNAPEKWPPLFDNLQQANAWLRVAKTHNIDPKQISLLKHAYMAKYGHVFEDKKLKEFFENQPWYEPQSEVKKISPKDKRIISLLEQM
jgi:hypothetical protein